MQIYPFNFPFFLGVNAYLVSDGVSGEAALIDCGRGFKKIYDFAAEKGLVVKKVLLTHGHFDHVTDAARWQETRAEIYIHAADRDLMRSGGVPDGMFAAKPVPGAEPDVLLHGGERISAGSVEFEVIHTPGHSPGSVCYLSGDALFTGDTLFNGSFGRYDFPGGSISDLDGSLQKLFSIPGADKITVYPGHEDTTLLGYEARTNPGRYCLK